MPNANNGGQFLGLLALLFIGLKLGHVIDWSWWWVLAPLWAPLPVFVLALALALIGALVILGIQAAYRAVKK